MLCKAEEVTGEDRGKCFDIRDGDLSDDEGVGGCPGFVDGVRGEGDSPRVDLRRRGGGGCVERKRRTVE